MPRVLLMARTPSWHVPCPCPASLPCTENLQVFDVMLAPQRCRVCVVADLPTAPSRGYSNSGQTGVLTAPQRLRFSAAVTGMYAASLF